MPPPNGPNCLPEERGKLSLFAFPLGPWGGRYGQPEQAGLPEEIQRQEADRHYQHDNYNLFIHKKRDTVCVSPLAKRGQERGLHHQ